MLLEACDNTIDEFCLFLFMLEFTTDQDTA